MLDISWVGDITVKKEYFMGQISMEEKHKGEEIQGRKKEFNHKGQDTLWYYKTMATLKMANVSEHSEGTCIHTDIKEASHSSSVILGMGINHLHE